MFLGLKLLRDCFEGLAKIHVDGEWMRKQKRWSRGTRECGIQICKCVGVESFVLWGVQIFKYRISNGIRCLVLMHLDTCRRVSKYLIIRLRISKFVELVIRALNICKVLNFQTSEFVGCQFS